MPAGKGRPRKPTALKVLHGDFEKNPKRRNGAEPTVASGAPRVPTHLSRLAKNEWKRVVSELLQLGVLSQVERAALEQYCEAYAEWRQCLKAIQKEGRFYATENGVQEHPAAKAARQWAGVCHKSLCEFGMTPASRSRLHVTEETPSDSKESRYLG